MTTSHATPLVAPLLSVFPMVKSVEIKNFRGLQDFRVEGLASINLIVGDNAVGKTAFLEAIFLTLCGDASKALILKQWRGQDITIINGSVDSVVEGIYSDLFNDPKSPDPISIKLTGDGFQNRSLSIEKVVGETFYPTKEVGPKRNRHQRRAAAKTESLTLTPTSAEAVTVPISLTWTDAEGVAHLSRAALSPAGLQFQGTGELIPNSQMFAAQVAIPAGEAADQFSALKKNRDAAPFEKIFLSVFDWIKEISLGTVGNSPVLLADVPWAKQLLPLPALSGGTNRAASILLGLTKCRGGTVLVDEIESGIFHTRLRAFAQATIEIARAYKSQIIMTSHSNEWISNFIDASGSNTADIALWRMERIDHGAPRMRRFSVEEFREGQAMGDMR